KKAFDAQKLYVAIRLQGMHGPIELRSDKRLRPCQRDNADSDMNGMPQGLSCPEAVSRGGTLERTMPWRGRKKRGRSRQSLHVVNSGVRIQKVQTAFQLKNLSWLRDVRFAQDQRICHHGL